MLRILRQLTPEETRQVALRCGARACATPEEVIRTLSRQCGVATWGLFPSASPEVLLDQVGQNLGMPPMGGPAHAPARERAILATYLRQAWEYADPARRAAVVTQALASWDNPSLPRPEFLTYHDDPARGPAAPEPLFQHSTGCRALALALETHPLSLGPRLGRNGGVALGRRVDGHETLYAVLLILWRARARRLKELRQRRVEVGRQLAQLEGLLDVRKRHLEADRSDWPRNPQSGLAVAGAAGLAAGIDVLCAAGPAALAAAGAAGAVGLAWALGARLLRRRQPTDERVHKLHGQIRALRHQMVEVEREILQMETE